MPEGPLIDEYATPTLMRGASGAYARAIRSQLHAAGVDDLPRNGAYLLAWISSSGGVRAELPGELGITKQAVSQAVDVLVLRGYVARGPDRTDRRRVALELTERGRQAVEEVHRGVEAVDRELSARLTPEQLTAMRAGLCALGEIKVEQGESGVGIGRPTRQILHFSPVFPVRDLAAALAHYSALGFETLAYEGGGEYGFANRDGTGIHLCTVPHHDPAHDAVSTYLYVRDADDLYEEWTRPGIGGVTHPVGPTPYKLREGVHVDPDGNVIRFGSPMGE